MILKVRKESDAQSEVFTICDFSLFVFFWIRTLLNIRQPMILERIKIFKKRKGIKIMMENEIKC